MSQIPEKKLKILLIEDNPGDALLVQEALQSFGSSQFEITHCDRVSKALEKLEEGEIDIALTDLSLPDSDGVGTFEKINKKIPAMPVIVLTGSYLEENIGLKMVAMGAQDYLVKGHFEGKTLIRAIRYAIERKRLEEMKDNFANTVAHELRTPLTILGGSIHNLIEGVAGPLNDKQKHIAETMATQVDRLGKTVSDLLELARLGSGKAIVHLGPLDLIPVLTEALQGFQPMAQEKKLSLVGNFPKNLPLIQADGDVLRRLFFNLIDNALRFAKSKVSLEAQVHSMGVLLEVVDDGAGIPADKIPHLFDKFVQLGRAKGEGYKGTGLGLTICKEIVDLHQGSLTVQSSEGAGSRFQVFLPLAE